MSNLDLEQITKQVIEEVTKTAAFIKGQVGRVGADDIEEKDRNSLVSYVDKEAEKMLVEGLQKIVPEAEFLTEENTIENKAGNMQWIIDPLDGTTNFLNQIPFFAVSVALRASRRILVGVVMDATRGECFYAWKDGGAYCGDRRIHMSDTPAIGDAIIATGFHYHDFTRLKGHIWLLEYFVREARGVRRFGSAALDLVYTACGRLDIFYEYSLNPWDVAAGALIVYEAGGVLFDFSGGENFIYGGEIVACNRKLKDEILKVIQEGYAV